MMLTNDSNTISPDVTEKKIQSFKKLENGWHYGEGGPLEQAVIDNAILLNKEAIRLGFYETDAFPGVNGEIMFTIYFGNQYLEFIIEPVGNVTFSYEEEDEEVDYQEGLSFSDARMKIKEFR